MSFHKLSAAVCASLALVLAGCSTPEVQVTEETVEIEVQGPREASVSIVDKSRAGAAIRSGEDLDVLYSGHYQGPTIVKEVATPAKVESVNEVKKPQTAPNDKSIYGKKKDRSVYSSKDKSVYSKKAH